MRSQRGWSVSSFQLFNNGGNNLEHIADNAQIGDIKYLRMRIGIDGHNMFGGLDTGQMLDGTADTAGYIQFRGYRLAAQSDLF